MIVPSAVMTAMYFAACIIGFVLGFVYDLLSFIRAGTPKVFSLISDMLFSIICAGSVVYFTIAVCNGELRIYNIIGFILGAAVYSLTSRSIKRSVKRLRRTKDS